MNRLEFLNTRNKSYHTPWHLKCKCDIFQFSQDILSVGNFKVDPE